MYHSGYPRATTFSGKNTVPRVRSFSPSRNPVVKPVVPTKKIDEQQSPPSSMAYALQCEKFAKQSFAQDFNRSLAYAHAHPKEIKITTEPANRGHFG